MSEEATAAAPARSLDIRGILAALPPGRALPAVADPAGPPAGDPGAAAELARWEQGRGLSLAGRGEARREAAEREREGDMARALEDVLNGDSDLSRTKVRVWAHAFVRARARVLMCVCAHALL